MINNFENNQKNQLELENIKEIIENKDEFNFLYPSLDDPSFASNLSQRKEFYDTRYEKPDENKPIQEIADQLCNTEFELAPHQMFVRNFMSFQTPYNGLLLYHGLGSGKTCSAISISEEMRSYLQQIGSTQKIIIVASPNVEENFKLQLFDERKLKLIDGIWNIRACTGNKYLKEINPMNMRGFSKEKVIKQVNKIIKNYYIFMGYVKFANYIVSKSSFEGDLDEDKKNEIIKKRLNKTFNNRLIIIDEVHNIRMSDDNKEKRVATELLKLVNNVKNMRLLLLSATPMYNSYKEIIWIINLLNINDNRSEIRVQDVFTPDGNFKIDNEGNEVGKELLIRKATGYISYVRGENPYTFPLRIWPKEFDSQNDIQNFKYPLYQLNNNEIFRKIEMLSLFMVEIGEIQSLGYNKIIESTKNDIENNDQNTQNFQDMGKLGYTILQRPLEALNIIYPSKDLLENKNIKKGDLVGSVGLNNIMKYDKTPLKRNFEYKSGEFDGMFKIENIGLYSSKIKNICESIQNSEGVILVYSQYIDGGIIPLALSLEEMGYRRAGSTPSLFKNPPVDNISGSYIVITGDQSISPNNVNEIKLATNSDNKNGNKVKVILISMAGAEGLDFKFIRQVHILEPWYNMNRIEQIIGRAVRTCSHKDLPFIERNVQIYLYGTILEDKEKEAADLYVYRLAEEKAIKIGLVSRVLKKSSIDCLLNIDQTKFSTEDLNLNLDIRLSNNKILKDYKIGDKPYSSICDYMEKCSYKCSPIPTLNKDDIKLDSYSESFILINNDKIIQRIKNLFQEKFFYYKIDLINEINIKRSYPLIQINSALNQLINNKNEFLTDMYGRLGRLINIDELYLFQPLELNNPNISIFSRSTPIQFKNKSLLYEQPKIKDLESIPNNILQKSEPLENKGEKLLETLKNDYNLTEIPQEIKASTDNWYMFSSIVVPFLIKKGINKNILDNLIISHQIENLKLDELIILLNYIDEQENTDHYVNLIKTYISEIVININENKAILLQNLGKPDAIVKRNKEWQQARFSDMEELKPFTIKIISQLMKTQNLGKFIGFLEEFKKTYMVFKVKELEQKRNKGARCDQAKKSRTLQILNEINALEFINEDFSRKELCVLQEFIFRYFNKIKKDEKKWFLTPIEAIFFNQISN
mgnify:FL=1